MLISIITPVLNRLDEVRQAVDSVQAQNSDGFEHIVIDDGSSDGTPEYLEKVASEDGRYRCVVERLGRKGAPARRNEGLELARGEYVIFLDSDDTLAPDCLERRSDYMRRNPSLDFAVFPNGVFDRTPGDQNYYLAFPEATSRSDLERFLILDQPWITTGPIWRREFLRSLGGWNESLPAWQDWELNVRALLAEPRYDRLLGAADCFWRRPAGNSIGNRAARKEGLAAVAREIEPLLESVSTDQRLSAREREACDTTRFFLATALFRRRAFGEGKRMVAATGQEIPYWRLVAYFLSQAAPPARRSRRLERWLTSGWPSSFWFRDSMRVLR